MNAITGPFRWLAAQPFVRNLRTRLVLLVVLASLPSLALLLLTANQQRDEALEAGRNETGRVARLVAADQQNVSAQISTVMGSLTLATELRGGDSDACRRMLQNVVAPNLGIDSGVTETGPDFRVDGASFVELAVLDNDQTAFCHSPGGVGVIDSSDTVLAVGALERGKLVAGNVETSATGSMLVTYAIPFARDDGQGRRALVAVMDVYALTSFAVQADLPTDSFILVFDSAGNLEQKYPSRSPVAPFGATLAGTPAIDAVVGQAELLDEQVLVTAEDERFVYGEDDFWTPGPDGATRLSFAMVSVPESVVVERANRQFNENLGKLAIAGMVGVIAAWIGADLLGGRDSEARKAQIRDFYHAFSTGNTRELEQIFGPGYVDRSAGSEQEAGIDGLRQNVSAFWTAFPDGRIDVRELLAERDKVVARVILTGTQETDFQGVRASGKPMVAEGIETFRFLHGMVVESWSMFGPLRSRDAVTEEIETDTPPVRRSRVGRIFERRRRATEKSA